ncbi:MAG: HupE/UreJ family protein [Cytophagales bacterium]|nr:HupE/UreJ family protein [Cytophagales bacterium]
MGLGDNFVLWFEMGWEHILDLKGYDHMLFVMLLCLPLGWHPWHHIAWRLSAFTVGHSLTLLLATWQGFSFGGEWVEVLIVLSIFLTAIFSLRLRPEPSSFGAEIRNYLLIFFFGWIHGMGFSSYLQSLLGKETQIWLPLVAFNLGVEAGQLSILLLWGLLLMTIRGMGKYLSKKGRGGTQNTYLPWRTWIAGGIALISLYLVVIRVVELF